MAISRAAILKRNFTGSNFTLKLTPKKHVGKGLILDSKIEMLIVNQMLTWHATFVQIVNRIQRRYKYRTSKSKYPNFGGRCFWVLTQCFNLFLQPLNSL